MIRDKNFSEKLRETNWNVFELISLAIAENYKAERLKNENEFLKKKYDPCRYGYHEWVEIPGVIEDVSCYHCGVCASEVNLLISERSI